MKDPMTAKKPRGNAAKTEKCGSDKSDSHLRWKKKNPIQDEMIVEMKMDCQQYRDVTGSRQREMTKLGKKAPAQHKVKTSLSIFNPGLNPGRAGSNPYDAKSTAIQAVNWSIEEMENLMAMLKFP